MTDRGIHAMHKQYGTDPLHTCQSCCNLLRYRMNRTWFKCAAYGTSSSIATDWRLKWEACGLYGKPVEPLRIRPLLDVLKHSSRKMEPTEPDPRQLTFLPDEQEAAHD